MQTTLSGRRSGDEDVGAERRGRCDPKAIRSWWNAHRPDAVKAVGLSQELARDASGRFGPRLEYRDVVAGRLFADLLAEDVVRFLVDAQVQATFESVCEVFFAGQFAGGDFASTVFAECEQVGHGINVANGSHRHGQSATGNSLFTLFLSA